MYAPSAYTLTNILHPHTHTCPHTHPHTHTHTTQSTSTQTHMHKTHTHTHTGSSDIRIVYSRLHTGTVVGGGRDPVV